jgi:hypothetical protein
MDLEIALALALALSPPREKHSTWDLDPGTDPRAGARSQIPIQAPLCDKVSQMSQLQRQDAGSQRSFAWRMQAHT